MGQVSGRRLLHLLCQFGLDTLSWAPNANEIAFTSGLGGDRDIWITTLPTPVRETTWGLIKDRYRDAADARTSPEEH